MSQNTLQKLFNVKGWWFVMVFVVDTIKFFCDVLFYLIFFQWGHTHILVILVYIGITQWFSNFFGYNPSLVPPQK